MTKAIIKNCKILNREFKISKEEQDFFNRNLPGSNTCSNFTPSLSPQARAMNRMAWRNDRTFFKRACSSSAKSLISIHPADSTYPVYHPDIWWSDAWDAKDYAQDIDFNKPFFEQWFELFNKVPKKSIDLVNCENCYYCNYCGDEKNCYLDIAGEGNEDCYYNLFTKFSKDCADCTFVYNSELAYESINCYQCHSIICGYYLENCNECNFCFDLKGCSHCLFSSNLRHKKYYVHNEKVSKEEYERILKNLNLSSGKSFENAREQWKYVIQNAAHRDMWNINSEACTGNDVHNSKNCTYSFNVSNCEDCKYLYDVLDAKDCQDLNYSLYNPEASYELISTLSMKYSAFCMASHYCNNAYYCEQCENSNDIFGCIGLKKAEYCILNKQYTKEEYEELMPKLIKHMENTGEWGSFFPAKYSPWGYSQTVAHEYYPLEKKQAEGVGFNWSEESSNQANSITESIAPDSINSDFSNNFSRNIYTCSKTKKAFKFTEQEIKFYRKLNLPLPSLCPDSRHINRMNLKPPRKLYINKCKASGCEVITSYDLDRKEKIYSKKAYLKLIL